MEINSVEDAKAKSIAKAWIGLVLLLLILSTYMSMQWTGPVRVQSARTINIEASQWKWSPQVVELKKGEVVTLVFTTSDVSHSAYIPEYGVNIQIVPNRAVGVQIVADKTGEFMIRCSEYCGVKHHEMLAKLIVR